MSSQTDLHLQYGAATIVYETHLCVLSVIINIIIIKASFTFHFKYRENKIAMLHEAIGREVGYLSLYTGESCGNKK